MFVVFYNDEICKNKEKNKWWKCPICHKNYRYKIRDKVLNFRRNINICPYCNGRTIKKNHY
ncbi:MAG: hypothetical protein IKM20_06775 [Erysipelotrichales bacterium]|nr:hypothetical protein [Erysipelotrichales bacterium]